MVNRSGSNFPHMGFWRDGTDSTWPDWVEVDFNGGKTINEIDVFTV